jgi:hypothetical protein
LTIIVILMIVIGVALLRVARQPAVTPAGVNGSPAG